MVTSNPTNQSEARVSKGTEKCVNFDMLQPGCQALTHLSKRGSSQTSEKPLSVKIVATKLRAGFGLQTQTSNTFRRTCMPCQTIPCL